MNSLLVFVSDSTGLTAENLGLTLISQFPHFDAADNETISFIKKEDIVSVTDSINNWADEYDKVVVFTTFSDSELQKSFSSLLSVPNFDLFQLVLPKISLDLDMQPELRRGNRYIKKKDERAAAIDYTLAHDDGQSLDFSDAEVIFLGLSRSGKTPTSVWLSLHYGLNVANYPITNDDFEKGKLPQSIIDNLHKCVLLLPSAQRLNQLRQERFRDSKYASLENCEAEIRKLRRILQIDKVIDVSNKSIEEIAACALKMLKIHPKNRF